MKDIKTLVDKPEYMHHAYFIPDAVGFMNRLKTNSITPFVDRLLRVKEGFNTDPHAFNHPTWHRNTSEVVRRVGDRGIIAQTIPSSRPKRTNARARWRMIINPSNDVIQGPNILNTIVDPKTGYFVMRGPVELTRTTDEGTRFIEYFENSDPNVNRRAQIIKSQLDHGEGILFLNTTLHRPPPERKVGQVRRQVAYQTNMTPKIMSVIQGMKTKATSKTRSGSSKTSLSPPGSHSDRPSSTRKKEKGRPENGTDKTSSKLQKITIAQLE